VLDGLGFKFEVLDLLLGSYLFDRGNVWLYEYIAIGCYLASALKRLGGRVSGLTFSEA
jgi:hypothetical protein